MLKHKKLIFFFIIIILAVGGLYYWKKNQPKVDYTTEEARRGDLARTVSVTGKLKAPEQIDLSFKNSGVLTDIKVDVGDSVMAGQKIASIDKGTLYDELNEAQANLKLQKETLDNLKRSSSDSNKDQRDAQRANIDKAQAQYQSVINRIHDTVLYAPISGTVIKRNADSGENISANNPVLTIAGEGELEIESDIPESDIVDVQLGQNADVTLDALSSEDVLNATVTEIEPASTVIQDVVYYKVKLKFNSADARLKNGMSADIDIKTFEKNNVITIPERAIKTENNRKYVEVLKSDNSTEKTYVETGAKGDEGMIEITSGLRGGEKIVTLTKNL